MYEGYHGIQMINSPIFFNLQEMDSFGLQIQRRHDAVGRNMHHLFHQVNLALFFHLDTQAYHKLRSNTVSKCNFGYMKLTSM